MTTMTTNQSYTTDARECLLPGYTTPTEMCREELKNPTMSKKSAEIYSNIRQYIPNTTKNFSSVKNLEVRATEIKARSDGIVEFKKHETLYKVGSIIALAVLVTLAVATVLAFIYFSMACPPGLAGLVPGIKCFLVWYPVNCISFLCAGGACGLVYDAFNCVPDAQKKLSEKVDGIKVDHQKLKSYFTANYITIKQEIETSIEIRNKFLGAMTGKEGADVGKLKVQYTAELRNFEKALNQLEDLHNYYTRADSIDSIDKFQL